jgi:adenosyl cobinamide kinase/adenosyl cobinamide phosphate guanylyltransferase
MQPQDSEVTYHASRHKQDRPDSWQTIEESVDIVDVISNCTNDVIIIDCISMWVTNISFAILGDFNEINEEFNEKQLLSLDSSLDQYSKKLLLSLMHRSYVSQMNWGLVLLTNTNRLNF